MSNVSTWTRTLPDPAMPGMAKSLVLCVALTLAGHANHATGKGISATDETIASEAWTTIKNVRRIKEWLVGEKWFRLSRGLNWDELECNFDRVRDATPEDAEAEAKDRRRAQMAAASRVYRQRKRAQMMTVLDDAMMTGVDDAGMTVPDDAEGRVIQNRHHRHQHPSSKMMTGVDDSAGHSPVSAFKSYKPREEQKNSPLRVESDHEPPVGTASESGLFAVPNPEPDSDSTPTPKIRYSPEFEEAWAHYERRGSKPKAFEEWRKATREVSPSELRSSIASYLQANPTVKYRLHFERWLKQRKWESDHGPIQRKQWDPHAIDNSPDWSQHRASGF